MLALAPVLAHQEPPRQVPLSNPTLPAPGLSTPRGKGFGLLEYFKIFQQFCQRPGMGQWLLILGLYAAAHNLSATMFRPLLVDIGLSLADIGSLLGVFGTTMSMLGALAAGLVIPHWGRKRSLLAANCIALVGIISYVLPTLGLTSLPVLYSIVSVRFFSLGMVGTASFTIMMDNSRVEMAGTDYTLQTSLIGMGSIFSAAVSGVLADAIGYRGVFAVSLLLMLVCLTLVARLGRCEVAKAGHMY